MKTVAVLACVFLCVSAMPLDSDRDATTLNRENIVKPLDYFYKYGYETSNGIKEEREEKLQQVNNGAELLKTVSGRVAYLDPDGKEQVINYTADKDGFKVDRDLSSVEIRNVE